VVGERRTFAAYFAELREMAARHGIPELSMGMSNDLEVAVEEGATWCGWNGTVREAQKAVKVGYHAPPPVRLLVWRLRGDSAGGAAMPRFGGSGAHGTWTSIIWATTGSTRKSTGRPWSGRRVVLHDAVLQHFFLGTRTHQQYIDEWVYNYGEWRRDMGEDLWQGSGRSSVDPRYFDFPMLRRIVECSVR